MRKDKTHWILIVLFIGFMAMIICPTACNAQAIPQPQSKPFIAKDKIDHMLAGDLIGWSVSVMAFNTKPMTSLALSVGSAAVVGACKEWYDVKNGTVELKDFAATVTGSVIGWAMVQGIKKIDPNNRRKNKKNNYTGMVFGKL